MLRATVRQVLAPGVILEVGDWRIGKRADGGEVWTIGQYTLVWRATPQGWLIQYDSWTPPQKSEA